MKYIITLVAVFLVSGGLKAQYVYTLPSYTGQTVVMKIFHSPYDGESYVSIDDAATSYIAYIYDEPKSIKKEKEKGNGKNFANCMDQLKTQGYKLVTSSSYVYGANSVYSVTNYIFQKE